MNLTFNQKKTPAFFNNLVKPLAKNKKDSKKLNAELATVEEDILARFDRLIAERKTVEARQALEIILQDDPLNIPLNVLMHSLLIENKEYKILAIHTKKFLNILVENKDYDMAAEVYYACRVLDKKCKPIDYHHYYPLAKALCSKQHYCTVIELLKGFHKNFPNNRISYFLLIIAYICLLNFNIHLNT